VHAAEVRFALAEALWNADRDRPRSHKLALEALATFRTLRPVARDEIERAETWVAHH
jgi:hypothetical protein